MNDRPEKRERAALDVLALLPDRWALGPTSYGPGIGGGETSSSPRSTDATVLALDARLSTTLTPR